MATQLLSYDRADDLETGLSKACERISALESVVYTKPQPTPLPSRERTLDAAQAAIRSGIDRYIDLGIIDADIITRLAHMIACERIALAEKEGRI